MPPTIKLIGVNEAKALLNAIAQISSLMIVITGWRHINWKEFFKMFVLMAVGMLAGIKIFELFPMNQFLILYGIMIIAIALKKLFVHKEIELPQLMMPVVIFAAGLIHGMFVSGGALLVIYAVSVLNVGPYIREITQEVIAFGNDHDFPVFEVPWHVHMADIMRMFCFTITRSEQRSMELSSAFRYAIFAPRQEELYVSTLMQKGYFAEWNYVEGILDICDKYEYGNDIFHTHHAVYYLCGT